MKKILIFCFMLMILLSSCSSKKVQQDFSQKENAPSDAISDTMENQALFNQREIKFDPDSMFGLPDRYRIGALVGDSIIYYTIEETNFDLYFYDTKTGQTRQLGSIDNYTCFERPLIFIELDDKYYFEIGRGDTYEDGESNVMQFTTEENSLMSCDSQYLSIKSVITKKYAEKIAQSKTNFENGKEINYIEIYDVETNQKSRFLSRDVNNPEGGFTSLPNFAVSGDDIYVFFQKYTPIYDENGNIIHLDWTSWDIEKYNSDGALIESFSCNDAKDYFMANVITQFYVWGDYIYFACAEEAAIYKMENNTARLVLKSSMLSTFYPAEGLEKEDVKSILFYSYSQQFYLFDFEKGEIKILTVPMNENEKIASCFRFGENICYEKVVDGWKYRYCYLTTLDDLMQLKTRSLDFSNTFLDFDRIEV